MTEEEKFIAIAERFNYDPHTGIFTWIKSGNQVKYKSDNGYIVSHLLVGAKHYMIRMHRLAWFIHYGKCPENHGT